MTMLPSQKSTLLGIPVNSRVKVVIVVACIISVAGYVPAHDDSNDSPERYAPKIIATRNDPAAGVTLLRQLPRELSPADLAELQQLDRNLKRAKTKAEHEFARELLRALVRSGELRPLGYAHQVFESVPWRRQDVARAIAEFAIEQQKRAPDWRLLVRAIPVVEGEDACVVLKALQMFPQLGTKPQWQREAILAGLRSGDEGKIEAVKLLRHWTGAQLDDGEPIADTLSKWQTWITDKHPELPLATLPVDSPNSRYKYADLLAYLKSDQGANGNADRGARIFEQAQCIRCHRFGNRGEAMGPNLSNVRQWLQLKQILQATLFPSQTITDQYETTTIVTTDGKVLAGVVAAGGGKIVVLQTNGTKEKIDRDDVRKTVPSRKSSMPNGLLNPLSLDEIADLFAYLRHHEP